MSPSHSVTQEQISSVLPLTSWQAIVSLNFERILLPNVNSQLSWERMWVIDFTQPRHYPNLFRKIGLVNFARCLRTDGNMQCSPPILAGDAKTKLAIEIKLGATTRNFPSDVPLFFFFLFFFFGRRHDNCKRVSRDTGVWMCITGQEKGS